MQLKGTDELNKALGIAQNFARKSSNFINGDGRDNRDTIHTSPLNNENGSISRTAGATGDGNDPVNSSNLEHTNPEGQASRGVHAQGTKTTRTGSHHGDPVNTSGDGHADDPENKSQTREEPKDSSKTKNGANRPHTQLNNGTRDLGDKPNANANAENHIADAGSGSNQHNSNDLKSMAQALVGLTKSVEIHSGQINELNQQLDNTMKNLNNMVNKANPNTKDVSEEAKAVAGVDNDQESKHIPPANVRGMFYHAEHAKGKGKHSKTHEMGEAEHAVTECHNSHKSLNDNDMKSIKLEGVKAMKNVMNSLADDKVAAANKSLDGQMSSAVAAGDSSAVGKINYKMNHSSDNKSMQKMTPKACARMMARAARTGDSGMMKSCEEQMAHDMSSGKASAASSANKNMQNHSMASCMSMMAAAKSKGDTATIHSCQSMMNSASSAAKNINNVDRDSKANLSSLSANSKEKPDNASDDINHSTKSVSASGTTKSMPHGKAINSTRPTEKTADNADKSMTLNPTILHKRAELAKNFFKDRGKHMFGSNNIVNKSISMANRADKNLDPSLLQKSLDTFNSVIK